MSSERRQRRKLELKAKGGVAQVAVYSTTEGGKGHCWQVIDRSDVDLKVYEGAAADEPQSSRRPGTLADAAMLLVILPPTPDSGRKLDGPDLEQIQAAIDDLIGSSADE